MAWQTNIVFVICLISMITFIVYYSLASSTSGRGPIIDTRSAQRTQSSGKTTRTYYIAQVRIKVYENIRATEINCYNESTNSTICNEINLNETTCINETMYETNCYNETYNIREFICKTWRSVSEKQYSLSSSAKDKALRWKHNKKHRGDGFVNGTCASPEKNLYLILMITFIILTFISGIISCVCFDETCCNSGYLKKKQKKKRKKKMEK